MTSYLTDQETVDHELARLKAELHTSLDTLTKLKKIQEQFAELLDTHTQVKAFHVSAQADLIAIAETAKTSLKQVNADLTKQEKHLKDLEEKNEKRWQTQDDELSKRVDKLVADNDMGWKSVENRLLEFHEQQKVVNEAFQGTFETSHREFEGWVERRLFETRRHVDKNIVEGSSNTERQLDELKSKIEELEKDRGALQKKFLEFKKQQKTANEAVQGELRKRHTEFESGIETRLLEHRGHVDKRVEEGFANNERQLGELKSTIEGLEKDYAVLKKTTYELGAKLHSDVSYLKNQTRFAFGLGTISLLLSLLLGAIYVF